MLNIKMGNISYFIALIILVIIFFLIYFILKNKSLKTKKCFLIIWAFIGLILHFVKQFVYNDPVLYSAATLENICAVSTCFLPFALLSKKNGFFKDSIIFLSILGGFAGMIYPTGVIHLSKALKTDFQKIFEVIRFYFCHFSLFSIALFTGIFDIYRIKLKRAFISGPIGLLIYLTIICINTYFVCITKLDYVTGLTTMEAFFSRKYMNNSFVFGPTPDLDELAVVFTAIVPNFMKTDYLNIGNGYLEYWPVLWMIIPAFVYFTPLYALIALPFNKKKQ